MFIGGLNWETTDRELRIRPVPIEQDTNWAQNLLRTTSRNLVRFLNVQ
jgi:hypothetical protein